MQIQILSDLHLEIERSGAVAGQEFYAYDIPVRAECLALLGDIGSTIHEQLFHWLGIQLKSFKKVFYVSGNHEPYYSSISDSEARIRAFADEISSDSSIIGEFVYLNRTRYDVSPTLTILGCTLWAALNPADLDILSSALTDFRRIDGFNPATLTTLHGKDLDWLNATVREITAKEPNRDIVIFTHHAPTVEGTGDPKFHDQPTNSAFATELTYEPCWMPGKVKLWAFGHTHWSCDFERSGIRVYSNQRGYGEGREGYDKEKVLEIP